MSADVGEGLTRESRTIAKGLLRTTCGSVERRLQRRLLRAPSRLLDTRDGATFSLKVIDMTLQRVLR